jgi:hypothetical protein
MGRQMGRKLVQQLLFPVHGTGIRINLLLAGLSGLKIFLFFRL